uniref:Uncharacterized protein n=2 Tax=Anopheles stephensi TaxID=30069 RepID=A0A182YCY1_ANOST
MPSTIAYCLTFVMTYVLLVKARPATERDNNLEHFEITSDQNGQSFSYKTTDNQWRDETVEINPKTGTLVISGWYRYTGPDGVIYQVKYVADENGYRPLGAHLPGADLSDPNAFSVFTPLVDTGISRTVLLSYETKDGQAREEVGTIDPTTGAMTVTGWYSYRTPDGAEYRVDFIADKNGYRVTQGPDVDDVDPDFIPNVEAAPISNALLLSLIAVLIIAGIVVCAPLAASAPIEAENSDLLSYENVQTENGYRFSYETKDGQAREEVGLIDPSTGALTVTGWYSYRTPDGAEYRVDYVADENGYRVTKQPGAVVSQFMPAVVGAAPINNALLLSLLIGVVGLTLVVSVLAAPLDDSRNAEILRYSSENIGIDGYRFEFATSDGTSRTEEAELRNAGTDNEALAVRGSYSYTGPDGTVYVINYIADENVAMAVPVPDQNAETLKYDSNINGVDGYSYQYETSNGISAQEAGELKNVGEASALAVRGSFTYTADDGQVYTVNYIADENGFQPEGEHIPKESRSTRISLSVAKNKMQTSIVILLFAGLLAVGYAAPRPGAEEKDAQVLKYDNDHNGIDGYNFQFDTSNGIQRQEQAQLKQFDDENSALVVRGSYSFTADDGQVYTFAIVFAAVLAVALAAPADERDAQVLKYENDNLGVDGYNFQYETSNNINRAETAELKNFGDDVSALVVRGSYSYTGPDGQVYTVNYVADENGFQPEAPHIPRLFESDDGISRQEQGELKTEEEGMNVQGNFKFVADDGQEYVVQYVADSQGFHPEGDHIPKEYVENVPSLLTMKTIIAFAFVVALALAAPLDDSKNAQILKYENDNIGVDGYKFAFETSDGHQRQEQAELRKLGDDVEALVVRGSYSFTGDDGQVYTVNYVADENGFQPEGAHLPTV